MRRPANKLLLTSILVLLALAVLGAFLWALSNARGRNGSPPGAGHMSGGNLDGGPGVVAKNVDLVGRLGGKVAWQIKAERLEVDDGGGVVHVKGVSSGSILRDGKEHVKFRAREAKFSPGTGELELTGGVTLQMQGSTVLGDRMTFDVSGGKAIVLGDVRIRSKGGEIAAREAHYLIDEDRLEVLGGAKVEIEL